MPSEVESPMCATARQDVRTAAEPAGERRMLTPAGPAPVDSGPGAGGRTEPAALDAASPTAPEAGTAPLRPAQATTSTPDAAVMAGTPLIPRSAAGSEGK